MKLLPFLMLAAFVVSGCDNANRSKPATNPKGQPAGTVDRDNTEVNERDRDSTTKTPLDQGQNKSDIDITAEIRKQVVATDMSVNAHNVKIITLNGKVTLRGPVKSADEKKRIEDIAHAVAGSDKVDSQLEVE